MRNIALMLFPTIIIAQLFIVAGVLSERPLTPDNSTQIAHRNIQEQPPKFAEIHRIQDRKNSFFSFLRPIAESENKRIQKQRQRLIKIQQQIPHRSPSKLDQQWLSELAKNYKVKSKSTSAPQATASQPEYETLLSALLSKVDQIPESLILSQAAIESAWGTSRFAQKANNYFGHWCYTPRCGIIPNKRSEGKKHQIKKFKSVRASVRGYIHNINSNAAYLELRKIRDRKRSSAENFTGYDLAAGLKSYSAIGDEYIKIVRAIIKSNQLENTHRCMSQGINCSIATAIQPKATMTP